MDYRVQKVKIGAQVQIRGRKAQRGSFFIVPPGYAVPDAELLLTLMNEPDDFVPMEQGKKILLLSKLQIVYLKLSAGSYNPVGVVRKVRVVLASKPELSGTVSIHLPEERQRALDLLNLKTPFFLMQSGKDLYIINKCMVQGVLPDVK